MSLGAGGGRHQGAKVPTKTDLLVALQDVVALLSRNHICRYTAYVDRRSSPPPSPVSLCKSAPSQALTVQAGDGNLARLRARKEAGED